MTSPFTHHERKSMTPQRRARIFAARHGICGDRELGDRDWGCGRKLGPSDRWTIEHNPALQNGGEDVDAQCYVICEWCVTKKNADDSDIAEQSRRRYVNHTVPGQFRRSRSWRR